jgi:hypothetical protein
MTYKPIQDDYAAIGDRQRRYYLRHREEVIQRARKYDQSEVTKEVIHKQGRKRLLTLLEIGVY